MPDRESTRSSSVIDNETGRHVTTTHIALWRRRPVQRSIARPVPPHSSHPNHTQLRW
jgi:hypothetical protein